MQGASRGGRRRSPAELGDWIDVDEEVVPPWPERVLVVDDVVCAGGHFVAARRALEGRFPGVRVAGVFVARVVRDKVMGPRPLDRNASGRYSYQ